MSVGLFKIRDVKENLGSSLYIVNELLHSKKIHIF